MINAVMGGVLIGIASSLLLFGIGRIAGNSGIIGGIFTLNKEKAYWKLFYIAGLLCGGFAYQLFYSRQMVLEVNASYLQIIIAGLFVGFGTRLSGGCTSGHGVCGVARFSKRSIAATAVFMLSGIITVWVIKQF